MERLYVESAGTGIIYESDLPLYDYFIQNGLFLEFPGLKVYKVNESFKCSYVLKYINSNEKQINANDNSVLIKYPIDDINEQSIIYPGYILIEKARLDDMSLSCHSSCIVKDENGILLFGKSGSGKTTTAINLCRKYGYSLIANDVSIIKNQEHGIDVLDGTKFLFLRYESIYRNLPDIVNIFNGKETDFNYINQNNVAIDTWRRKIRILPSELDIKTYDEKVSINKAYMIHVDERQSSLYNETDKTLVTKLYLNECLSKTIRGINTTFLDKNNNPVLYIPSMDTIEHYQYRIEIIRKIINECSIEYVSGNINDVSEYINTNSKGKVKIK